MTFSNTRIPISYESRCLYDPQPLPRNHYTLVLKIPNVTWRPKGGRGVRGRFLDLRRRTGGSEKLSRSVILDN